jgi:serine/threonine protein kinase
MIGEVVSHYRILEKLGEGGMGVVYKAEDTNLKRTVALKFLHASDDVPRLMREARVAASLNHPNICTVYDVDPEGGFLAMELVEGKRLTNCVLMEAGCPVYPRRAAHAAGVNSGTF